MKRKPDSVTRGLARAAAGLAVLVLSAAVPPARAGIADWPEQPGPAVATVAGAALSAEEFRSRYVDYLLRTGLQDAPPLRSLFLDRLIADRLLAEEARAAGLEAQPAFQFERERVGRKLLLDFFTEQAVYDAVQVDERDLADLFVRTRTTLKARHLYARTKAEADRLYARLQAGETFEALARETFADSVLAARGGSVGPFGFDEMDPAFEDAAFALQVGEVAPPVRTAQGYSIIQLEERSTDPLLTEHDFARQRDRLAQYALHRKRAQARLRFIRSFTDALNLAFDEPALEQLFGQLTGRALMRDEEAFRTWLGRDLVSFTAGGARRAWTVEAFREQARFTDVRQRAQVTSRQDLVDFIGGVVAREVLLEQARAAGLDERPVYREALGQAMTDWLAGHMRDRIAAGVVVTEDSVRAAFAARPAAFAAPEAGETGPGADLRPMTYEEARPGLYAELHRGAVAAALDRHVRRLRARFAVTVDRDRLARLPLVER